VFFDPSKFWHGATLKLFRSAIIAFNAIERAREHRIPRCLRARRGEKKRLLELTFRDFAPELVRENLAAQSEVDQSAAELTRLAGDATTLFGFPLLVQVWATRV
jgi:hypothetical protein